MQPTEKELADAHKAIQELQAFLACFVTPTKGRPMPYGVPPPPHGYVYAGVGREGNELNCDGVVFYTMGGGKWYCHPIAGRDSVSHYALPPDSPHFDKFDAPPLMEKAQIKRENHETR